MHTVNYFMIALGLACRSLAHTGLARVFIDGVDQGLGTCIRMSQNPHTATHPIMNVQSADMACGFDGNTGVSRVCPAKDGSSITFEYRSSMDHMEKGPPIDPSHLGPCAIYLKKVSSAAHDLAAGSGWFKIWHEGVEDNEWCTTRMVKNNGHITVKLPPGLEGGYYLVRSEILTLQVTRKPEFYVGCAQIFLQSSGQKKPEGVTAIPGHVSMLDPGLLYDVYQNTKSRYTIPGPPIVRPALLEAAAGEEISPRSGYVQTEGLTLPGTILTNANWCGVEVPSYSSENGCWSSSQNCWDQSQVCYNTAPPTGSQNCRIWDNKCREIQRNCRAGNWNGPPHKGKVLTPSPITL